MLINLLKELNELKKMGIKSIKLPMLNGKSYDVDKLIKTLIKEIK